MEKPLVSICCITYNHEAFIKEALEGFVMQKTNFPYEIVISDDCSKDRTRSVIAEYKAAYPDLFNDVSPDQNMGAMANFQYVQKQSKGKYIAICEGDDYWIDPYKLQKQVDFMETHPDYVACFHNARVYNGSQYWLFNSVNENHFPSTDDIIIRKWFIATPALMFRNCIESFPEWSKNVLNGDFLLELLLAMEGKFYYMDDAMAVYRKQGQGLSVHLNARKVEMYDKLIYLLTNMKKVYGGANSEAFDISIVNYQKEKAECEKEHYYETHPFARVFRLKTYKRKLKRWLKKFVY